MTPAVDITPSDPLMAYFLSAPGPVELDKLHLDSPALARVRAAGVTVGRAAGQPGRTHRRAEPRSPHERAGVLDGRPRLLTTWPPRRRPPCAWRNWCASNRQQARDRERIEQELRIARLIQQTLLPKELPVLPGWKLDAYYQPARAVGGDFYDFIHFEHGRMGIVIGDVTDKGVPAALVMATTRSICARWQRRDRRAWCWNASTSCSTPTFRPKMFVTCLYAVLDPVSGRLRYANAGHDLPYQRQEATGELRATGMPLGLMPGMHYEEKTTMLGLAKVCCSIATAWSKRTPPSARCSASSA